MDRVEMDECVQWRYIIALSDVYKILSEHTSTLLIGIMRTYAQTSKHPYPHSENCLIFVRWSNKHTFIDYLNYHNDEMSHFIGIQPQQR